MDKRKVILPSAEKLRQIRSESPARSESAMLKAARESREMREKSGHHGFPELRINSPSPSSQ